MQNAHPGVSMAAVALANGLNANMLRKWAAETDSNPEGQRLSNTSRPQTLHPR